MDYLGHKKLEKNNGIYSSIDGIPEVGGLILLVSERMNVPRGICTKNAGCAVGTACVFCSKTRLA